MSRTIRNAGLHTTRTDSEFLILEALASQYGGGRQVSLPLSALGYAAYPGYRFKAPQGAALAAAKLVRAMQDRELVGWSPGRQAGMARGYYLRPAGCQALEKARQARPSVSTAPALPIGMDTKEPNAQEIV